MKRRYAFLLCAGGAAAVWAAIWTGLPAVGAPSAGAEVPVAPPPGLIEPAGEVGGGPDIALPPDAAPLPATVESAEPAATGEPGVPVEPEVPAEPEVPVEPALPEEPAPGPGGAHLVAGAGYDFARPVPETEPVERGYFADALFIGDSRTEGFRMFSGLEEGDYIVKTGLSVFKVEKDTVKLDGKKVPVLEALDRASYGKVYICLGLNELGMYDDQGYYDHYAAFLDRVRESQPGATVYIQLLIPVNEQKCAEKKQPGYITNEQIGVYNALLYQLAQEKHVFLLDPAEGIVDESGQPPYDAVADGVHFQKGAYQQWLDYLTRHTVDKGEWE